jgi:predicted nuclease of predicted toxin-antitoxin system
MKLLIDMNLAPRWTNWLVDHGIESVHWSEVGAQDAPDTTLFDYAAANGLTIFSKDLDFGYLLSKQKTTHPSLILVRAFDTRPEMPGPSLIAAIQMFKAEIETGALVTIQEDKHRVRMLPF